MERITGIGGVFFEDAMLAPLRATGVWVDEKVEDAEFGRPEGTRVSAARAG
ncbi:MAG: hypothetical protein ABI960_03335 [Candidatus Eisenbacteria bacterium]